MLGDITVAENIYIACGHTDMRKSIDGLAAIVQQQFHLDPFSSTLFLFCGRRRNRMKALLWEGDGFILLYKRLENGSFKWPRDENKAELETDPDAKEPVHFRKGCAVHRNTKTKREELLKDIPVVEFPCMVHPDEMYCGACGGMLKEIGFTKVRDEIQYIPAQIKIIRYMQQAVSVLRVSIVSTLTFIKLWFPNPL